jgi:hypothetical protein
LLRRCFLASHNEENLHTRHTLAHPPQASRREYCNSLLLFELNCTAGPPTPCPRLIFCTQMKMNCRTKAILTENCSCINICANFCGSLITNEMYVAGKRVLATTSRTSITNYPNRLGYPKIKLQVLFPWVLTVKRSLNTNNYACAGLIRFHRVGLGSNVRPLARCK